jgi:hydrophobic/amphiphilic exporter-1 (mainly G- bacteria), HAE1 family
VQNRVAIAEPRLPEEVRALGVTTVKRSPNLMIVVHLLSPDNTYDQLYVSNYAVQQIQDVLARTPTEFSKSASKHAVPVECGQTDLLQ